MTERYLTQEELKKIVDWDFSDYHGLMEYVKNLWAFDAWGFHREDEIYHLSTGGWSGNEDIISAMEQNTMFWSLYWFRSTRGGHYIFAPMTFDVLEKLYKEDK